MSAKILFADDILNDAKMFSLHFSSEYEVTFETSAENAKQRIKKSEYDVYIFDLYFKDQSLNGLDLLDAVFKKSPRIRPIVLTGDIDTERVVKATQKNFVHVLVKNANTQSELKNLVEQVLEQKRSQQQFEAKSVLNGNSPELKKLIYTLERLATRPSKPSLLITGETGTGKELVAGEFARLTGRKITVVNMAILEKDRAESALFGHVKGAFTGAHNNYSGFIKQAHGGILFMDEIGECSPEVQAKLLRVLQDRQVRPMGGDSSTTVDVQFVCATHQNLRQMVQQGKFREDLYQRLSTFKVHVPALRQRRMDILPLFRTFLNELDSMQAIHCDLAAEALLLAYEWPGNIRELKSVAERCLAFTDGRLVTKDTAAQAIRSGFEMDTIFSKIDPQEDQENLFQVAKRRELSRLLEEALSKCQGNRSLAAKLLGVSTRSLQRWISKDSNLLISQGRRGRPKSNLSESSIQ